MKRRGPKARGALHSCSRERTHSTLIDRFKQSGQGETAESWINTGSNKPCTAAQLEQAIGPEVLDTLSKQIGLSRGELVTRLCRELPDAVDKYTPQGRLPMEGDFSRA